MKPRCRPPWSSLLLATATLAAACRSSHEYGVREKLATNDVTSALTESERLLAGCEEVDRTMLLLEAGTCHLLAGDSSRARERWGEAAARMGVTWGHGQDAAMSTFRSESVKEFKGEAHEQCLCCYYLGCLSLADNQPMSARAWFRAAQLGDRTEGDQCDFALLFVLDAVCSQLLGDREQVDLVLGMLLRVAPDLAPLATMVRSGDWNTVLLVEDGQGPRKVPSGERGAFLAYDTDLSPLPEVTIEIGGRAVPVFDVGCTNRQVSEGGVRVADLVNQGKSQWATGVVRQGETLLEVSAQALASSRQPGVTAEVATRFEGGAAIGTAVSGVLMFASLLARPQADLRGWTSLPRRFQLGLCRLPTGPIEARLDAKRAGATIATLSQRWTSIPGATVPLLAFRLLPGRQGGTWRSLSDRSGAQRAR